MPLQWPLVGRHEQVELFAATLEDMRAHGFVIFGAAGIGKTRLADECLAVADRLGRNVARATAAEASQGVPLGALAHLLPADLGDHRADPVRVMTEVRQVLAHQTADGPLVLFVDDLHLLDATSATLVGQLVDADLVFLVGTVRTGEGMPAGLDALWHRARVRRVDLSDLNYAGVDTLLHVVLGGPVEATTTNEVWTRSQGNALFVRELVLGALDDGTLIDQRGVWRLTGPLMATPRLQEVVATRIGALDQSTTEALEVLAVWEPASLSTLESIIGQHGLEALDRSGLLVLRADQRRQQVTLAHPLYGEILRARMPALTRRRLLLEHADRIDSHGARRREDPISVANARLEVTGSADPALLVKAARLARYGQDFPQVERLARAATIGGMTAEGALLVGEALHELGSFEEAEEVFLAAEGSGAGDDELLVPLTEMRSRNLMWGLFRHEDAIEVNRAARARLGDRPGGVELVLNEAMLLTYSGRPSDALTVLAGVGELTAPRDRALGALAEAPALIATGRCETALDLAGRAYAEHEALPEQIAIPGQGIQILNQIYALSDCGRLEEATGLASVAYEAIPANAPPDAAMWLAHQQGRCALLEGRLQSAARWLGEAAARCEAHNLIGPRCLVLSALATAQAGLGDAAVSAATVVELERLPGFPFARAEQELGRGWALVAAGDLPRGRMVLRKGADLARATGYLDTEAWLLHDVARLGDAGSVAGRLAELATRCEGELVAAYAHHAEALVDGGPEALTEATDRFERLGAVLIAAEAATDAARAWQRVGDGRSSAALGVRASALAGRCESARTPALTNPVMVVPLTPRERDIATLAAQGDSSKDIADQLTLSVRTVNNHLQSVYAKLGVAGRHELADALSGGGDGR